METVAKKENKIKESDHSVFVDRKKLVTITAVVEVVSAQDSCVVLKTEVGGMQISGTNLRVEKLSLEEKILKIEGDIYAIKYTTGNIKKGFFSKLFK